MSYSIVLRWHSEEIAVISFQDPPRQNQLCWAAVDELAQKLAQARQEGARAVILASGLAGHWLEHAWLGDLQSALAGEAMTGTGIGWFEAQQELTHPGLISIAAVSGDCSGGGAELGWACDLRVAERQARFAQPEIKIQLTTGIGGCSRLARLVGAGVAAQMLMTGNPLGAERLYQLGAVNELVAEGAALDAAIELAGSIVANSPEALSSLKLTLASGFDLPLAQALEQEQQAFQKVLQGQRGRDGVAATQARFDKGEQIEDVYQYSNNID